MVLTIDDVIERYFFGSTKDNRQVNYIYINQLDLLKKFILYFKEVAKPLIDKAENSKIIIPNLKVSLEDKKFYSGEIIQEFLHEIKLKKVSVRVKGKDILINPNEAKILSLMKCGYTAKEISKEVGLTQKTIEIYRDKLRDKLSQFTKGNLVTLANSNSLLTMDLLT